MVIYGGATGGSTYIYIYTSIYIGGGLASDDLFLLDVRQGEENATWVIIPIVGQTPGRRYGHALVYFKPHLILFGGNQNNSLTNDVWCLPTEKMPFTWTEVQFGSQTVLPPGRVYHTAALCSNGSAAGMIVIFGGRGNEQKALNDSYGLRKHRDGRWDWVMAPYKSETKPTGRYQHSAVFVGSVMLVVGGRGDEVSGSIPFEAYDTESAEWQTLYPLERFRTCIFTLDNIVYAFGGFEQSSPNVPNGELISCDLTKLLASKWTTSKGKKDKQKKKRGKVKEDDDGREIGGDNNIIHNKGSGTKKTKIEVNTRDLRDLEKAVSVTNIASPQTGSSLEKAHSHEEGDIPIRFSTQCQVAMSYNADMPTEFAKLVRNLDIDKLQEESKKLGTGGESLIHSMSIPSNLDSLCNMFLNYLLRPKEWSMGNVDHRFVFKAQYVVELAKECLKVMEEQPIILSLRAPIKIFGDIHGQFQDLMRFFDLWRGPTEATNGGDIDSFDYLFLGDYVDRGSHSLETICLLMSLKIKYPKQIHLLRGNHEDKWINNAFGFAEECMDRLHEDVDELDSVFQKVNDVFEWLPLAAIIENKIICLHGGIGSSLISVDDIRKLQRPLEVIHEVQTLEQQLLVDILWSDPTDSDEELGIQINAIRDPNGTGNIVRFGPDRVQQFLKLNNLTMILRAHECVMDGFERFAKGQLITVFSATDYCGRHKNAGAVLVISKNLEITPKLIFPIEMNTHVNWIETEDQLKKRPPTPPRWKIAPNNTSYG